MMKLKLDAEGHVVVKNGQPVYVHDDGKEFAFDAAGAMKAILSERFANSNYVAKNLTLPADVAAAGFGKHFRLEGDKLVPYDSDGKVIMSRKNIGDVADFDEALESVVSQYPERARILKAVPPGGDGGQNGRKAGAGPQNPDAGAKGGRTITRAAFDKLDPVAKSAHVKGGGKIVN